MSHERKLGRAVHEPRLSPGDLAIGSTLVAKIKPKNHFLSIQLISAGSLVFPLSGFSSRALKNFRMILCKMSCMGQILCYHG